MQTAKEIDEKKKVTPKQIGGEVRNLLNACCNG